MRFFLGVLLGLSLMQMREADPLILQREYVIASCTLDGASHELDEGYFRCGGTQLFLNTNDIAILHLRDEVGKKGQLIWRRSLKP